MLGPYRRGDTSAWWAILASATALVVVIDASGCLSWGAHPADLGAKLEKMWRSPLAVKVVDDRGKTLEPVKRLI